MVGKRSQSDVVSVPAAACSYTSGVMIVQGSGADGSTTSVTGKVRSVNPGELAMMLTVDVAEQLFFDSGRATLKDTGKDVLKRVADAIKSYDDKAIRVVGHTDNVPISGALQKTYATNWELSVARATTVVRFLQEAGIEPERLVATGRAEYAPIAENDSPEGRQKNRRIEITLINKNLF